MLITRPDDPLVLYRLGFGYFVRGYGVQEGYIKNSEQPPDFYYALAEQAFDRLLQGNRTDSLSLKRNHGAKVPRADAPDRGRAEAEGEVTIVGYW